MAQRILMLLALLAGAGATLLRDFPMIMAHDAATGYLPMNVNPVKKEVYYWTMTQKGTFYDQLQCGARSFDLRPAVDNGKLVMHHGKVNVETPLSTALADAVRWAKENPSELVVFVLADCSGSNCKEMTEQVFAKANITMVKDCSLLVNLTVDQAKQMGRQVGGGSLLVFDGCTSDNYDPKISCYPPYEKQYLLSQKVGVNATWESCCYGKEKDREEAFTSMWKYLNRTQPAEHFSQWQALWQESTDSVILGTLYGSSLLLDESRSGLNKELVEKVKAGWWPKVGLLEVNYVCDQGPALFAALRARSTH